MKRKMVYLLMAAILILSNAASVSAQDGGPDLTLDSPPTIVSEAAPSELKEGIAPATSFLGANTLTVEPSGLEVVSIIVTFDKSFNPHQLEAISGGKIVYKYSEIFNGVSMVLAGDKVDTVATLDGVTGVYLDQLLQPDTERSPAFIGAPVLWDELGGQGSAGEGIIVGVLDTGIWPEHPSFLDPDSSGKPYAPPHTVPGSNGFGSGGPRSTCDFGNGSFNPYDAPFACNNKLIGAYEFLDTYKAVVGLLPTEFDSARDSEGHGTHTTSTAAGNGGVESSIFGIPRGTVSGIAPRAQVIMYRVCADEGCYSSDSVRAVEQAILDNVDSINFSISGGTNPYSDVVEQAFSVAYDNGVFVSASAGNSGPGANTVAHRGPWTMTVAASTTDRLFSSTVSLIAENGDTLTLEGASVTAGIYSPTPVVLAADYGDGDCLSPFPAGTFSGEIVVCRRAVIARVEKSFNVAAGGGGGMLLYNPVLQGLATDNHFIPSVHLEYDAGQALLDFMATHTGVMGTFTQGVATAAQGDVMAAFSSRGGPAQNLGVSKPDITAPGVQILAGHTPLPSTVVGGAPGQYFQAIQGTSMSSPHIAGSAALVKALHPDWTPGQIKSALMMTANGAVVKEDGVTPADPFDYGSGRVDLSKAGNPGFTISDSTANFYALQDQLWNANYPSLYVPVMPGQITVQRTAHSELSKNATWKLSVDSPSDMVVDVPSTINVKAGGDTTFAISVDARGVPIGEVRHATLYFQNKSTVLRFPITIVRGEPSVTLEKSCTPAIIGLGETTDCTITVENTNFEDVNISLFDNMPPGLPMVVGSVTGATQNGASSLSFNGTLFGAGAPVVDVAPSPLYGYISLSVFGVAPFPCPSNCDDGAFVISGLNIDYLGEHYTTAIWSVNGTLELGTASGVASSFANQNLPDSAIPNNVLAPWWTDLNLGAGGNWYLGALTDGVSVWDIFEWQSVPRFGDPSSTFSFQIWLEQGTGNITFTYGGYAGNTGDGTTGAENHDGTIGDTEYYDGAGTLPWGGPDLGVASVPGTPGETHVITYTAIGEDPKLWTNCAEMTTDLYQATNVACFSGETLP